MNKKLLIAVSPLLLITLLIIIYNVQPKDVPRLQLQYIQGGENHTITAQLGTRSWKRWNSAYSADSLHPMDSIGYMPEISKTKDLNKIILLFEAAPTKYSVRYWTDNNIGNIAAYESDYTSVEVTNNTVHIPEAELGLIYEVHAFWPQGDAYYSFYITNKEK